MKQDASDAELILKCKQGNSKYQEMLYKRYYAYAMGVGMRYLVNRDDALEVVNDAFIKVFKSIGGFQEGAEFKPWFRKILVNTALDHKRKQLKYAWQDEIPETRQQTFYPSVLEKLSAADILNLMKVLPEVQQIVFNLYEIDGYSHKEIGNMLSMAESSSRTYLTRAKQTLQKLLHNELIKL
jgi:RNA polymerase sigma factor (sigma-70 family)